MKTGPDSQSFPSAETMLHGAVSERRARRTIPPILARARSISLHVSRWERRSSGLEDDPVPSEGQQVVPVIEQHVPGT